VYIRKRLNISPIDRIIYYIYLFWKGSRGGGLGRTVGDCKQIGVGVGPAHQAPYVQFLATPLIIGLRQNGWHRQHFGVVSAKTACEV